MREDIILETKRLYLSAYTYKTVSQVILCFKQYAYLMLCCDEKVIMFLIKLVFFNTNMTNKSPGF